MKKKNMVEDCIQVSCDSLSQKLEFTFQQLFSLDINYRSEISIMWAEGETLYHYKKRNLMKKGTM